MGNNTYISVLLNSEKTRFSYPEFDLKGDIVGETHARYLSDQSFITRLKLVWRELDMVAMNNWKKMFLFAEDMS